MSFRGPSGPLQFQTACIVYRCQDKELQYVIVRPKAKEGEPFSRRIPLGTETGTSAAEAATQLVKQETGYDVGLDAWEHTAQIGTGEDREVTVFLGLPEQSGPPEPAIKGMTAQWMDFKSANDVIKHSAMRDALSKADTYLREVLPGPLIRRDTSEDFKPVLKRVIDMCGPGWPLIERICEDAKADGVSFHDLGGLDLTGVLALYPVRVALRTYFQRTIFLLDERTLGVAKGKADLRDAVLERLGATWEELAEEAERRLPIAVQALRELQRPARSFERACFGLSRPAEGSVLEAQLRTLLANYPLSYAIEERLRIVVAMCADGTIGARGLSQCPDPFAEAVAPRTLLRV